MLPDHQIFTMEDGVFILREATVNAVGRFAQPGVGLYHKSGWVGFDINHRTVVRYLGIIDTPIHQLIAVVTVLVAIRDREIAGNQFTLHLCQYAQLEILPVDHPGGSWLGPVPNTKRRQRSGSQDTSTG